MTLSVGATIDGAPLAAGDEIAIWSVHPRPGAPGKWERTIVGSAVLVDPSIPPVRVNGDDGATLLGVEGAAAGEELCLALWRASEGREYTAYRTPAGDPLSIAYGEEGATLSVSVDFTQGIRIPLRTGGWNLVSAPVLKGWKVAGAIVSPAQLSGSFYDNVAALGDAFPLRSIAGRYDRVIGSDGRGVKTWDPRLPAFSLLDAIQPGYGYWIRTKASAQPLAWVTFPGAPTVGDETLSLDAGWKLLGFWKGGRVYHEASVSDPASLLLPTSVTDNQVVGSIGELWSSIDGSYQRVMSFDAGARTWNPDAPAFSTLKYLAPGSGYWVKVASPASLALSVAPPAFSPLPGLYDGAQAVTLASATSGASIRYTLDNTIPTAAAGTLYSAPIAVAPGESVSLIAIAYKAGEPDSRLSTGTWRVTGYTAAPEFGLPAGSYPCAQTLSLSTPTPGATIRYTTDGSLPTATHGAVYTAEIPLDPWTTTTIRAIATRDGWVDSAVSSASYTILETVAMPAFSPDPQTYVESVEVTISTATPGAAIRYTTNGLAPTASSGTPYEGPVTVAATRTLRAIAYRDGWVDSPVASGSYMIVGNVVKPAFGIPPGSYTSAQSLTIATPTPGAAIRYTTDGSAPSSTHGAFYVDPIALPPDSTTAIRAVAYREWWTDSEELAGTYTITGTVAAPVFELPPGSYATAQVATISTGTAGAAIRYTTDGTPPTSSTGTVYTGPIPLPANSAATFRAIACKPGWIDSPVAAGSYEVDAEVSVPTASPLPGAHTGALSVTLATATPDAAIRYTTDGSTPSPSHGTPYAGPIPVPADAGATTIRAIAYRDGWRDSGISSGSYSTRTAVAVAAGTMHSLMLRADGTVSAWGWNFRGQLGDGTTTNRILAVDVGGLSDVIAIAAGGFHSMALMRDGTVWTWGYNSLGQLGDGSTTERHAPVRVQGLENVVAIAAGTFHSLAVTADNTAWAWGSNNFGELGDGTGASRVLPVRVQGLADIAEVSAGGNFSIARRNDGTVWGWGKNLSGQLGDNTTTNRYFPVRTTGLADVVSVSASGSNVAAATDNGSVWVWGDDTYGQIGDTGAGSYNATPYRNRWISDAVRVVSAGRDTFVLTAGGEVWSWGSGDPSRTGTGGGTVGYVPVRAQAAGIVAVAAGSGHTLTVGADGVVWAWGRNINGEIGDGTNVTRSLPVRSGIKPPASIAAGAAHSVLVKGDGSVWSWGSNRFGQLGDGTAIGRTVPGQIPGISDAISSAAGRDHTIVLKGDGTVWGWGANDRGQLGDGTRAYRTSPVQVAGLTGVVAIAAGQDHSVAVRNDNSVWTWGRNDRGQLGDLTRVDRNVPVGVTPLQTEAVAVAAGAWHTLALTSRGEVLAWGGNGNGQLGDGGSTDRVSASPVSQANGLGEVVAIAAGESHSAAIMRGGKIWTWGLNGNGQLGSGTTADWRIPGILSVLTEATSVDGIVAGDYHTLALASGSFFAWGLNGDGQLGDGTTETRLEPHRLSLTAAEKAAAGLGHTILLRNDGSLWTWGRNADGELGDGTTTPRSTPGPL
jgi:alpha-tubulin suppressor-like RCC1 family protein